MVGAVGIEIISTIPIRSHSNQDVAGRGQGPRLWIFEPTTQSTIRVFLCDLRCVW